MESIEKNLMDKLDTLDQDENEPFNFDDLTIEVK